jgi:protein-arginine kinase activator protein McsA
LVFGFLGMYRICNNCGKEYPPTKNADPVFCSECSNIKNTQIQDNKIKAAQKRNKRWDRRKIHKKNKNTRKNRMKRLRELPYTEYLKTKWWNQRRKMMWAKAKGECQRCGSNKNLNLHHKNYKRIGGEKTKDLILLCGECHKSKHAATIYAKKLDKEFQQIVGKI